MNRHDDWGAPRSRLAWRLPVVAAGTVLVLALSFVVPVGIGDGLARLPAGRREAGREALGLAVMGCLDNPIQRAFTRAARLRWLHPAWQPGDEPSPAWRPEIAARVRTYGPFGVPLQHITVLAGDGVSCWHVVVEREYPLQVALANTRRSGTARFLIRLPEDAFPVVGVVGRIGFDERRSVIDLPPPPELAHLPFDAYAVFAAVERQASSWVHLGDTGEGSRFGLRDTALALSTQQPWVPVAVTVGRSGHVVTVEYVLPGAPTRHPVRMWLFGYRHDEPLDMPPAVPSTADGR